jgi:hypothetical protein
MSAQVGAAAKLTVRELQRGGLRFAPYVEFSWNPRGSAATQAGADL